jgi:Cu2+-exporting ATPase
MERCFHCDETIPPGSDFVLEMHGERRHFCCPGCRAVAELIESAGLARFYDFRSAPARKATARDARTDAWAVCDRTEVSRRLTRPVGESQRELHFRVDGVNCAACSWLIERGLKRLEGVEDVILNPVSHEALVRFDPERVKISRILDTTQQFGFAASLAADRAGEFGDQGARDELKRLAVAGLGFAQVMTLSAALYLGAFKAMDTTFTSFFELASMLVATPVVLYAGAPIFRSALSDLGRGRVGMDVPVGLAVAIALAASLVGAFRGVGPVYFDSATMFVFFLTLGRFLEARARHNAGGLVTALGELKPLSACRRRDAALERVGSFELERGDIVVVEPGEAVPADGELLSDGGTFDESLLSGESTGRRRGRGDTVLGGSLNAGRAPLEVRVTRPSNDGYIEQVGSLLHRAIADRPEFLRLADRWARAFVLAVLALTAATGVAWLLIAPARALEVTLAMLIVTCPCALSLAAPTAFAVALGRLARLGLLCRSARVFERLGQVTVWFFDKTGTLTEGRIGIVRVETLGGMGTDECLEISAALEAGIEHPIARAFRGIALTRPAADVEYQAGSGVSGYVAGRSYRLGSADYVGRPRGQDDGHCVYLASPEGPLARIVLADRLRPHAREAVAGLAGRAELQLVSGDAPGVVSGVARALGFDGWAAVQSPADKLERLRACQEVGGVVAAVGDGINDAPLLAQADVSIAMVAGSRLAQAGADVVFTGEDLRTLARLPALARATRSIVRQNLVWAVIYNLTVLPLAATGILVPWMAALGMSLSSLVVVGNALRLSHKLPAHVAAREPNFSPAPVAGRAGR